MKDALAKVRKALSRHDIIPALTQYLIHDGTITAGDGRYVACAPTGMACDTFAVPGREFERLVDRLPAIDSIQVTTKDVTISGGRMRGTIKTNDPSAAIEYTTPGRVWSEVPPGLLDALQTVRPFISDNAIHQWALCACLGSTSIYATTNISLIQVDCPMLDGSGQLLPCWAIDHLLARKDAEVDGIQVYPDYVAFRWDDGSWLRTQLINDEFPSVIIKLMEKYEAPTWELTDDWRAAYKVVSELTEGLVEIHANKLVGREGAGVTEHETPDTPAPPAKDGGFSSWNPKFLDAVIKTATHWQPDIFPQPAPFAAQGVRGFIMGRR